MSKVPILDLDFIKRKPEYFMGWLFDGLFVDSSGKLTGAYSMSFQRLYIQSLNENTPLKRNLFY